MWRNICTLLRLEVSQWTNKWLCSFCFVFLARNVADQVRWNNILDWYLRVLSRTMHDLSKSNAWGFQPWCETNSARSRRQRVPIVVQQKFAPWSNLDVVPSVDQTLHPQNRCTQIVNQGLHPIVWRSTWWHRCREVASDYGSAWGTGLPIICSKQREYLTRPALCYWGSL